MYNSKFILADGREIYPGYLDKEKREQIKKEFAECRGYMWCGCKSQKLYYRISEDLRIYPEHNNYNHDINCSRHRTEDGKVERKTGYVINEEDGVVTAFLTFNPKKLTQNNEFDKEMDNDDLDEEQVKEAEEEAAIEKDESLPKKEEKKEPKLSLAALIRSINVDTFTEKIMNELSINSRANFSVAVYHRMMKVKVSKMKKALGELSLESDGVRFIYLPFAGAVKKEDKGLKKCYMCTYGSDGKIYNNFIFPDTLEKAVKEFVKSYGIEPNEDTILAGFQYINKTRSGIKYRVLGRVHLFQASNTGIYSKTLVEKEAYDSICNIIKENKNIKFWIPAEDDSIGGVIQINGKYKKILLLFRGKKNERLSFNSEEYFPLIISLNEPLTMERLNKVIEELE